ncbi:hypothetical protein OQA88_11463 [Cercophora sp. LCS_1]
MATAADLLTISQTDVQEPLPNEQVSSLLSTPPFVYVPGTFNTRDIGLVPGSSIKPGLVFRTGSLGGLQDQGKALLKDTLGIKTIFDLRSIREHASQPYPEIEGIQIVRTQSQEDDAVVELSDFVEGEGESGYTKMYLDVLRMYAQGFKEMLEHVRDRPGEAFLFHCNAGRDRTGVAAGLLQALAVTDPDAITLDFMLSRIGTEPARAQLLAFAMKGAGITETSAPGFHNLVSLKIVCWNAFVQSLNREHGGWTGYAKTLGFSEDDLLTIKRNLTGSD